METLEDLKAIIAGRPEDGLAAYIDDNGDYCRIDEYGDYQYYNGVKWIESGCVDGLRSLSDIGRIIELMEVTKDLLPIFAGSTGGYWRNELKAARKALGYE